MRVFGASGAIGTRLVPQLIERGHEVIGTSRSPGKAARVRALGAEAITLDLLDARAVRKAVLESEPDAIVHQATALADLRDFKHFDRSCAQTNRLRTDGTDALLAPVRRRQFPIVGEGGGVSSFIHVDDAAAATVLALEGDRAGIYNVVDDEPALVREWLPVLASVLGARPPRHVPRWLARLVAGEAAVMMGTESRGASNAKAKRELGWTLRHPSWREGFVATYALGMRGTGAVIKRTLVSFYDDQMTHHAAALTYYGLMSLFPTVLLGLSLLGLVGQYPETYDAIMGYVREVAPDSVVTPLDRSLEQALRNKGTAATALAISVAVALYGTTGVLEAARRALNVVFEIESGRSFLRRKLVDVASTVVLLVLSLVTGILVFVGGSFADDLLGFIGLGSTAADVWNIARWPAALLVAMLVFAFIYFITPDVKQRSWRWVTPGAVIGVLLWLVASWGLSTYISTLGDIGAIYGTFAGAIVLVAWMWLTNVSLLFGAELNAEIERQRRSARASRPATR